MTKTAKPPASTGDHREFITGRTIGLIISAAILFGVLADPVPDVS